MKWIDVHTHLGMIKSPSKEVVERALEKGVERLITIGTCPEDHKEVVRFVEESASIFGTLGIHPHDSKTFNKEVEAFMKDHFQHEKIVGVGEIGLDYYYENSDRETQKKVFIRQMELAEEHDLPVEIHTRDAEEDTVEILKKFHKKVKGLIHCFTGTSFLAKEALSLGYGISISGIVTFKNADALRETVSEIPLERIHVETDSPYLTPHPFRGKPNEPSFVVHTAEKVAEIKGVSLERLSETTRKNALELFKKLVWN